MQVMGPPMMLPYLLPRRKKMNVSWEKGFRCSYSYSRAHSDRLPWPCTSRSRHCPHPFMPFQHTELSAPNFAIIEATPLPLMHVPPVSQFPFHDLKARKHEGTASPATQCVSFTQGPSLIISGRGHSMRLC